MTEIKIGGITLKLSNEGNNVRVKSDKENIILMNQSIDTVSEIIRHNFDIVSNHYKLIIGEAKDIFDTEDLNRVSIAIVLYYLYMYNSWRSMYKEHQHKDLKFDEKDFESPSTHDTVFHYFKAKYPNKWEEKCAAFLGMELDKLKAYYKTREYYYNR